MSMCRTESGKQRALDSLGARTGRQVNCSRLFGSTLTGLQLQVARQVPQLHDQVTKENFHILHLFEKKAHLVVQVGVGYLQRRGVACTFRGRTGRWRQRPGELCNRRSWSR